MKRNYYYKINFILLYYVDVIVTCLSPACPFFRLRRFRVFNAKCFQPITSKSLMRAMQPPRQPPNHGSLWRYISSGLRMQPVRQTSTASMWQTTNPTTSKIHIWSCEDLPQRTNSSPYLTRTEQHLRFSMRSLSKSWRRPRLYLTWCPSASR